MDNVWPTVYIKVESKFKKTLEHLSNRELLDTQYYKSEIDGYIFEGNENYYIISKDAILSIEDLLLGGDGNAESGEIDQEHLSMIQDIINEFDKIENPVEPIFIEKYQCDLVFDIDIIKGICILNKALRGIETIGFCDKDTKRRIFQELGNIGKVPMFINPYKDNYYSNTLLYLNSTRNSLKEIKYFSEQLDNRLFVFSMNLNPKAPRIQHRNVINIKSFVEIDNFFRKIYNG